MQKKKKKNLNILCSKEFGLKQYNSVTDVSGS